MIDTRREVPRVSPVPPIVWAALAAVTLPFANGRFAFWLAPWVAFLFLALFVRSASRWVAVLGGALLLAGATQLHVQGALPFRGVSYVVAASVLGLAVFPPFLLDRWASRRLPALPGGLVLPASWVALEFVNALLSPYATWGAVAYTQKERLALVQIVSLTGLHGLSFLVLWFASTGAFAVQGARRPALVCGGVLLSALTFGALRLSQSRAAEHDLTVGLVTPDVQTYLSRVDGPNAALGAAIRATSRRQTVTGPARKAFDLRSAALATELLDRTARAAAQGARLVVWSEGALMVAADGEAAFLTRAGDLARETGMHLALAYLTLSLDGSGRIENVAVLVGPDGQTLWRYLKAHPVPGLESCVRGTTGPPVVATALGTLSTATCFDADFPAFVRPAARADLLIVPSDDWREIDASHSAMAAFRAVELGVPLVRSASAGISTAVDAYGREIAALPYFRGEERLLVARVGMSRTTTLHAATGDIFPMACVAGLLVLLAAAFRAQRVYSEAQGSVRTPASSPTT